MPLNGNFGNLFTSGVLIDVTVSYWSGQKKLQAKDVGLEHKRLPDIFSLGRKRLLPKDVLTTFRSFAERADYLLECEAFPFPIAKVRFVPEQRVGHVCATLDDWKAEFGAYTHEFCRRYQDIREQMLADYAQHREALATYYPRLTVLKQKFSFSYDLFTIELPKRLKVAQITAAKVDRETKARDLAETRYRERITHQVDAFLSDVVAELRRKTTTLCEHVAGKLQRGELITEATLGSLRDWITQFEGLNFVGDRTVSQQLAHLRQTLGTRSAQEYREQGRTAQALGRALDHIVTAASDLSDVASVTGAYKRRIRLD